MVRPSARRVTAVVLAVTGLAGATLGAAACAAFGVAQNDADASTGDGAGSSGSSGSSGAAESGAAEGGAADSGSGFCDATTAKRCYDFDTPNLISPFGFDDKKTLNASETLDLDDAASVSTPASLLVSTKTGGSGEVVTKIGAPPASLSIGLSVRYEEIVGAGVTSSHFVTLRCTHGDATGVFVKLTDKAQIGISQFGNPAFGADYSTMVKSTWTRLFIQLDQVTKGSPVDSYAIAIQRDGVPLGPAVTTVALGCTASADLEVRFGSEMSGQQSFGDWVFRFDNVVVDWP